MKRKLKNIDIALLLFASLCWAACSGPPGAGSRRTADSVIYTCPMHPQIQELRPGDCPICGMPLVRKSGQASQRAGIVLSTVLRPVNSTVLSDIAVISPKERREPIVCYADGYLDFDSRNFNDIAARFSGRIDKLYIKYAFQPVHRGERIMDIYSPEMVAAQEDLIFLVSASSPEPGLVHAARTRLQLLGMSNQEISAVIQRNRPFYSLPVYSPYDGHVHDMPHRMSFSGNGEGERPFAENLPLGIQEGMYVQKGELLFNVVNAHQLWAVFKIAPKDLPLIHLHQPVEVTLPAEPGRVLRGRVDFIEPVVEQGDKSGSIRVYLPNMDHQLKVNSLARAAIETAPLSGLWVPRSAVLQLGTRAVVWVRRGPVFHAQAVTTGPAAGNDLQIQTGLMPGDSIAVNAQYLSDSESFIQATQDEQAQ